MLVEAGYQRLDALQHRIAEVVRALPGARALVLFGSRVTYPIDPYADLDLRVVTDDLALTRQVWPQFLEHVAPIRVAWPITSDPDNTAFTILFAGEHLFHKVDISLSASTGQSAATGATGAYRVVWEQSPPALGAYVLPTHAFMPVAGTVGHALLDDLIGGIRYVKARKRQQPLTCWRFVRGKPDLLFRLRAEQQQAWRHDLPPLTTWTYKALDAQHDPMLEAVFPQLDWATPLQMDRSCLWLTRQIARLFVAKAVARQEVLPLDLMHDHIQGIATELSIVEQDM